MLGITGPKVSPICALLVHHNLMNLKDLSRKNEPEFYHDVEEISDLSQSKALNLVTWLVRVI